jgi:signal transduction histidine kinase
LACAQLVDQADRVLECSSLRDAGTNMRCPRSSGTLRSLHLELKADARLPEPIEVAAYYVASEALANVSKHAQASRIEVSLASRNGRLVLSIRDDGVGGADRGRGSGLVGLQDRVEALGGTINIDSSAGCGTCVVATLPIATEPDQEIENVLGPPQELGSPMGPT